MGKEINKKTFSLNLVHWWLLLTLLYVVLFMLRIEYVATFIGLFVPFGPSNLLLLITSFSPVFVVAILVIFLVLFYGRKYINKLEISSILKFFIILLLLFLLTIAVDFIIYQRWASYDLLLGEY